MHAVQGLDLDIAPGELVAVLGPNGAGKSTTMRMLTTLIAPTAGRAEVGGHDVVAEAAAVRRSIGYVGQGNGAGHNQRVRDELRTQGAVFGLDRRTARRRADELLDGLDLTALACRKVSSLSGGQRRRLDVAIGLVHAPSILFLDEPSTGVDPQNRANLWGHVLRMRDEHAMTVVLTTHYMDEADTMAERVVVVDHGRIIADDTADRLKADLAGDRIEITSRASGRLAELARRLEARDVTVVGGRVQARVADGVVSGKRRPGNVFHSRWGRGYRGRVPAPPFGVYVHVPFCAARCGYCDFNTYTASELAGSGASPDGWLEAVRRELALAAATVGPRPVDTVFVGGGTPSLIGASRLGAVLAAIRATFGLAAGRGGDHRGQPRVDLAGVLRRAVSRPGSPGCRWGCSRRRRTCCGCWTAATRPAGRSTPPGRPARPGWRTSTST